MYKKFRMKYFVIGLLALSMLSCKDDAKTDAAAMSITAADITTFIDTVLNPMFTGAGWSADISNAADETITARIGLTENIDGSVSANEDGFRNALFAAVISAELVTGNFNTAAQSAASQSALAIVGTSSGELAELQGRTGALVNRISESSERISVQMDELTLHSDELVNVDPYEAATRLNTLITQIETSYTLTGRLQQMSLMRFI